MFLSWRLKTVLKQMARTTILILVFLSILLHPNLSGLAQEEPPAGAIYIVQEGDTLWSIAVRFGISIESLQSANNLGNVNQLAVGDRLVIPGLTGFEGVITTQTIPFGETVHSLSRRYRIPTETLVKLNKVTSPAELFAGRFLTVPEIQGQIVVGQRASVPSGASLLELAVLHRQSAWQAVVANGLEGTWDAASGDILLFNLADPAIDDQVGPNALPGEISSIEIDPLPFLQGKATLIRINADSEMQFSGSYMDHELHFFQDDGDVYIAIQGTHALAAPGLYPLQLEGSLPNGSRFSFSQLVPVGAVDYPYDRPLTVNPTTIDPAVTRPEDAQWVQLASPATSERMWQGIFQIPSPLPADYCIETGDCWSSRFGNRRSYNGGPYNSFHTGLDIVGKTGTEIYAPAPGVVIFAGPLTVRGNATMIDHGWGVYTAYMHQDEILVEVGDKVEPGQLIGRIGSTGRVEGPHLHWEVWAGGVQVDPLDWLLQAYP